MELKLNSFTGYSPTYFHTTMFLAPGVWLMAIAQSAGRLSNLFKSSGISKPKPTGYALLGKQKRMSAQKVGSAGRKSSTAKLTPSSAARINKMANRIMGAQ